MPVGPVGTVLITGGASGLGAATARAVAGAGGRPLVIDLAVPPGAAGPGDPPVVAAGRRAALAALDYELADLADRAAAEEATRKLADRAGGLDAVFTAAGTDACGRLADVPADQWDRVIAVNLVGTVAVVRAALPFDGRDPRYRPPADAMLNDPADVASAVLFALTQPPGCELRELVICPATEPSWP